MRVHKWDSGFAKAGTEGGHGMEPMFFAGRPVALSCHLSVNGPRIQL